MNKIFIRNSVKVSHSCTRNKEHIIKNHNTKFNESYIEKRAESSCNSKEKNGCTLEGNCSIRNIVYMATELTMNILIVWFECRFLATKVNGSKPGNSMLFP